MNGMVEIFEMTIKKNWPSSNLLKLNNEICLGTETQNYTLDIDSI